MTRWLLAIGAGSLLGVAIGGVVFILTVELVDGRQEVAWLLKANTAWASNHRRR